MKDQQKTDTDPQSQYYIDTVESYKKVFATEDGQAVLYDLMKKGYFLSSTFDRTCPEVSPRNEGMRELVVYILETIKKEPKKVLELINNNEDKEKDYYL